MDNNVNNSKITELEHKLAVLHNENETLKRHCKNLNEYVKDVRTRATKHTKSLITKNDVFKAQLQERDSTITTLKNELRKLTRNDVNTKLQNHQSWEHHFHNLLRNKVWLGNLMLLELSDQKFLNQGVPPKLRRIKFCQNQSLHYLSLRIIK